MIFHLFFVQEIEALLWDCRLTHDYKKYHLNSIAIKELFLVLFISITNMIFHLFFVQEIEALLWDCRLTHD